MSGLLVLAAVVIGLSAAAPTVPWRETADYLWVPGDPAAHASSLAGLEARARLVDHAWILIELPSRRSEEALRRFAGARRVAGPLGEHRLYALHEGAASEAALAGAGVTTVLHTDDLWLVAIPADLEAAPGDRTVADAALDAARPLDVHAPDLHAAVRSFHAGCIDAHPMPWVYDLEALAPRSAEALANPYRANRLDDPAVRARTAVRAGQVSEDNLRSIIRELSETAPGVPRSRFAGDDAFATEVVPLLRSQLESVFSGPNDTVTSHDFDLDYGDGQRTFSNLIARRPGRVPGSGRYVLGAHYDATGSRNEPEWDPATEPAPGADDNASGVACLLEAARVLLQPELAFDFDIEVIFFSAEEVYGQGTGLTGLVGSRRLIDELDYGPDNVLGMVAVDMVGYNPRGVDSLTVVTNGRSEWLADLFDAAETVVPVGDRLDGVEKQVRPTFNRSDHGAFWSVGADAVLLVEVPEVEINNPNYHRSSDTFESLVAVDGFDRTRRVAELIVATIGQYANPTGTLRFTADDLTLRRQDGSTAFVVRAGDDLELRARILNDGPSLSGVQVTGLRSISPSRTPTAAGLVASPAVAVDTTFATWGSGAWREIASPWSPTEAEGGAQDVRFDLTIDAAEIEPVELGVSTAFQVIGSELRVQDAYVRPNPIRGSIADAWIAFQVSERAYASVEVVDVLGRTVGRRSGTFFDVGRAEIRLSDVVAADDLPSGIYVARILVDSQGFETGSDATQVTIAVVR